MGRLLAWLSLANWPKLVDIKTRKKTMKFTNLPKALSMVLVLPLLVGCSEPTAQSMAKEICNSRFSLIDLDPNSDAGAPKWVETWQKAIDIRNSSSPTDQELAVAGSMDDWFNAAYNAFQEGRQWPVYGEEFGAAGLQLNDACQAFD